MRSCRRGLSLERRGGPNLSYGLIFASAKGIEQRVLVMWVGMEKGWLKVASEKPWRKRAERGGQEGAEGVQTLNKAVSELQWGRHRSELLEMKKGKGKEAVSSPRYMGQRCSSGRSWVRVGSCRMLRPV